MSKRESYIKKLEQLLASPEQLESFLLQNSALPGRRANLELAWAFADLFNTAPPEMALGKILVAWATLDYHEAPINSPQEFLPFCAVQALGACYLMADQQQRDQSLEILQSAASDQRWRTREAACFAFQRIGEHNLAVLLGLFEAWLVKASLIQRRAMLVSLAHPPLLEDPEAVRFAFDLADQGIRELERLYPQGKLHDQARVLRKCLEFAPSVFTVADPEYGFEQLRSWAQRESIETKKIVAANLRKARLAKRFPEQIEELATEF